MAKKLTNQEKTDRQVMFTGRRRKALDLYIELQDKIMYIQKHFPTLLSTIS